MEIGKKRKCHLLTDVDSQDVFSAVSHAGLKNSHEFHLFSLPFSYSLHGHIQQHFHVEASFHVFRNSMCSFMIPFLITSSVA